MKQVTPLQSMLQREVSRQEFLTMAGLGVVSLMGLSSIIKFLTGKNHLQQSQLSSDSKGYGSSAYGR